MFMLIYIYIQEEDVTLEVPASSKKMTWDSILLDVKRLPRKPGHGLRVRKANTAHSCPCYEIWYKDYTKDKSTKASLHRYIGACLERFNRRGIHEKQKKGLVLTLIEE